MFISFAGTLAVLGAVPLVVAQETANDLLASLQSQAIASLQGLNASGTCTMENAYVRKDWKRLTADERTDYINAVLCLREKPSKSDPSFAPGARTRYDDFVAVHISQAMNIHKTANFLTWHRYYVWAYEHALRDECGYKGYQPYWDWFDGSDFANSPLFDGSETSMSGDGEFMLHNGTLVVGGTDTIHLPSGNGGGCIKDGPFKGAIANLGPVSPEMDGMTVSSGLLAYNPHCLSRDLEKTSIDNWFTREDLHNITLGQASQSIALFQVELNGRYKDGFLGLHATGHYAVGGDASDAFSSPNEPVFFLHHAMVDYLWWLWQAIHPEMARDIHGTLTPDNVPPTRQGLLTDLLNLGVNAPDLVLSDALDSLGNTPFCYIYA